MTIFNLPTTYIITIIVSLLIYVPNTVFSTIIVPSDPSLTGPFAVSRHVIPGTVTTRNMTVEVWYPSSPNATTGKDPVVYDLREHLPPDMAAKLKGSVEELGISQTCDMLNGNPQCFNELPFEIPSSDDDIKKRPVILFIHGTGAWRGQSLQSVAHWVSRGFVVVAADYPGINLKDLLENIDFHKHGKVPKINQSGDTILLYNALQEAQQQQQGEAKKNIRVEEHDARFDFFINHVNLSHVAIIGHSAGAFAVDELSLAGVGNVFVPMAGLGTNITTRKPLKQFMNNYTTLILGGENDTIDTMGAEHGWTQTKSPPNGPPKRYALVKDLGHHFCDDICAIGAAKGGIVAIAKNAGIWQASLMAKLANNGCQFTNSSFADPKTGWEFVNYATSAVLENYFYQDESMVEKLQNFEKVKPSLVLTYKEALYND